MGQIRDLVARERRLISGRRFFPPESHSKLVTVANAPNYTKEFWGPTFLYCAKDTHFNVIGSWWLKAAVLWT